MTSISGSMSIASMMSPSDRMKLQLQAAVSAGTVSSADQSALGSALDDIDSAMKAGGPPAAGTDPSSMKTKVDSLVDQEVTDGKLTSDQATELKQLFGAAQGGPGGMQSADAGDASVDSVDGTQGIKGAHRHHGGPPPPPPSDDDSSDTTSTTASSTDTTKAAIEQLISFLKQLETATSSATTYASSGASTGSSVSSVLVDANA